MTNDKKNEVCDLCVFPCAVTVCTQKSRVIRRLQRWFTPLFLAIVIHLSFWWIPVRLEGKIVEKKKELTLKLQWIQPPTPVAPTAPKVNKPVPRKIVKKRRTRRVRKKIAPKPILKKQAPQMAELPKEAPPKKISPQQLAPKKIQKVALAPVKKRIEPTLPAKVFPTPIPKKKIINLGPYRDGIGSKIGENKQYPRLAQRMGMEGKVVLSIQISRTGDLLHAKILKSSGHSILDREAIRMVKASLPFPAIPSGYEQSSATFQLPINFTLEN